MHTSLLCFALRRLPNSCQPLASASVEQRRLYSIVANTAARNSSRTTNDCETEKKLIKVAVIGVPNAGKSSFINQFIDRRVCPTSRKVHTTQTFSKTICNKNEAQMILFDTPGLVTSQEMKKHHLSSEFVSSCRHSIQRANLIAVIHDVSNSYTRNVLHSTVLQTLQEYSHLPSILVLNKIDMLKSKRILLDLVNILTEKTLVCKERRYLPWNGSEREFIKDMQRPVKYKNKESAGWPRFSEVFMVSSLSGDGMQHVRHYLRNQSVVNPWEYMQGEYTDQPAENLIVDNVRAVLLDYLPEEIPYNLKVEMEYFDAKKDRMFASVNVVCPSKRIERLVSGSKNNRMQQISETVTSELVRLYQMSVSLVINVISRQKSDNKS